MLNGSAGASPSQAEELARVRGVRRGPCVEWRQGRTRNDECGTGDCSGTPDEPLGVCVEIIFDGTCGVKEMNDA